MFLPYVLVALALAVALGVGYFIGRSRGAASPAVAPSASVADTPAPLSPPAPAAPAAAIIADPAAASAPGPAADEQARLLRSFEAEAAGLRRVATTHEAEIAQLSALAVERRRLFHELADARAETARYRQVITDLENNAPPPLLGGPGAPDDLKLIVGVGPVLERMLYQLGITTYRQIARWTERDIDEIDARLHEFPGRIRRDGWVTQARALHQSKYGADVSARDRG